MFEYALEQIYSRAKGLGFKFRWSSLYSVWGFVFRVLHKSLQSIRFGHWPRGSEDATRCEIVFGFCRGSENEELGRPEES